MKCEKFYLVKREEEEIVIREEREMVSSHAYYMDGSEVTEGVVLSQLTKENEINLGMIMNRMIQNYKDYISALGKVNGNITEVSEKADFINQKADNILQDASEKHEATTRLISSLDTRIDDLGTKIATNEGLISDLGTKIDNLGTEVAELSTNQDLFIEKLDTVIAGKNQSSK